MWNLQTNDEITHQLHKNRSGVNHILSSKDSNLLITSSTSSTSNYSKIWSVGDNFVMKQRLKETVGLAGESSNTPPLNQQVLLTTSEESMTSGTVREGVLECLC